MSAKTNNKPGIQMTLFEYFMEQEQFSLNDAIEVVKQVQEVKEPSIRARIYEGIDKGLFERVSSGVYTVKRTDAYGNESNCLLINGNGRDLSMIADNSIDALITDHPYKIDRTLKGGNRDFASYESFQYEQKDLDEKCRVLKDGCFLVEFLPEENAENYKYIFQIKEMAEKAGLEYFTTVPWKKGDFVANTGRKSKNTEQVVMFTKGKARNLRLDMKKIGKDIEKPAVITYKNYTSDITASSNDEPKDYQNYEDGMAVEIKLIVTTKDKDRALKELDKAWDNWWSSEYESLPLYSSNNTFDIYDLPIGEYMLEWLKKMNVKYLDIDSQEFRQEDYFMSGASGMLPTVFDVEPVSKNEKIHQAEKPVELLEQIINFVTQPNEKILDQFAGSGVVGEAALNTKRDSVLIEKDEDTFKRMCERLNKRDAKTKSMEKAKKI